MAGLSTDAINRIISAWEGATTTFRREGMSQNFKTKLGAALRLSDLGLPLGNERRKLFGRMSEREQLAVLKEIVDLWKEIKRLHRSDPTSRRLIEKLKKVLSIIDEVFR